MSDGVFSDEYIEPGTGQIVYDTYVLVRRETFTPDGKTLLSSVGPTDEQVNAIAREAGRNLGQMIPPAHVVRAVLAAAAGGDR